MVCLAMNAHGKEKKMPRKTVDVKYVRDRVNYLLQVPDDDMYLKAPGKNRELTSAEAYRMAAASLLESILMETGNYKGFGYQEGQITRHSSGVGDSPDITDETRRVYY